MLLGTRKRRAHTVEAPPGRSVVAHALRAATEVVGIAAAPRVGAIACDPPGVTPDRGHHRGGAAAGAHDALELRTFWVGDGVGRLLAAVSMSQEGLDDGPGLPAWHTSGFQVRMVNA